MAYLGNAPARSFISFERQVFTIVNSQTAYTLSHSVTNENDIRLVVNNVVQEPGSGKAYTASGTTLTLSAALTNGTDEMYCVFLGRAVGTVNAPAGSVTATQLVYPLTTFSSTGIDDNADATAMTINSSEQVGIGTTSPSCALDINGGSVNGNVFKTTTSGDNNYLAIDNTSTGGVEWVLNSSGNGSGNGGGNFAIQGPDSNTVRVMVHSNGVTSFNNGIALGVGTANTASNVLDDYEEGTFTPTWTSNVTVSVASGNYGYYTKIGDEVTIYFGAVLNSSGGTPNYFSITNAPFQSNLASGTAVGNAREYGQTGHQHMATIGDNSTTVQVKKYDSTAVANPYLACTVTYRTD